VPLVTVIDLAVDVKSQIASGWASESVLMVSVDVVPAKSSTEGAVTVMPATVSASGVPSRSVPPLRVTTAASLTPLLCPRATAAPGLIVIPEVPSIAPSEPDVARTPPLTTVVPE
jgi:hypothetical protein